MGKKLKALVCGLGKHAQRGHIEHLRKMPQVEFAGVFDADEQKAAAFAAGENLGAPAGTFEELICGEGDALFIFSPDAYHLEQARSGLERGLNVFVEKPCALDRKGKKDLTSLKHMAEEKGLVFCSCYPRRCDDPYLELKSRLESGWVQKKIGEIVHFNFSFWYHKISDDWKMGRSLLLDHFGQEADALSWAFGLSENWHASCAMDKPDIYLAHGHVGKKLSFSFMGSRRLEEAAYREAFRIDGTSGSLFVDIWSGKALLLPTREEFDWPVTDFSKAFEKINKSFVDSCLSGQPLYMPSEDWLRAESMASDLFEMGLASY